MRPLMWDFIQSGHRDGHAQRGDKVKTQGEDDH